MKQMSFGAQSLFFLLLCLGIPTLWSQQQTGTWRPVGTGDCPGHDIGSSPGSVPAAERCEGSSYAYTAVCWSGDCTYKNVPAGSCTGGANPGKMYICEPVGSPSGNTVSGPLTSRIDPAKSQVESGGSVHLQAIVSGGTPPYAYEWKNGDQLSKVTSNNINYTNLSRLGDRDILLTVHDAEGSTTETHAAIRVQAAEIAVPASAPSSNLRVDGAWTDTSSICGGSTYTLRQASDGTIQSVTIKVSCNGGHIAGSGAGSGMTWKNATTLGWSYRYSSHSSELIETGVSELVFAADGKTARLTTNDSAGHNGVSALVLAQNTNIAPAAAVSTPLSQPSGTVVNLALRKPATQSSVYRGTGIDQGPQFGNDGILESQPRDPYLLVITDPNDSNLPWWQVDLQGVYTLMQLKLYNRKACCQERAKTVQVLLSTDGAHWERAYVHNGTSFDVLTVDLTGRSARYVRLQLTERVSLHFQECEVYGYAGGPYTETVTAQSSPEAAPSSLPAVAPLSPVTANIAGTWQIAARGETWTFTAIGDDRYKAVGRGSGNASGIATVIGNRVRIDYARQGSDEHSGYYQLAVEPNGRKASGRFHDDRPANDGPIAMTRPAVTR